MWNLISETPPPRDGSWVVFADKEGDRIHLAHVDMVVVGMDVWYLNYDDHPHLYGYTHWKPLEDE